MYPSPAFNLPEPEAGYVPYFYYRGLHQLYGIDHTRHPRSARDDGPSFYDFTSDARALRDIVQPPTVEQIIARGYFAVRPGDPVADCR